MNRFNLLNLRCFGLSPGRNQQGCITPGAFGVRTRRKIGKLLNLICLALLGIGVETVFAVETASEDMVSGFVEANRFYNEGNFQRAAKAYESMARHVENGYLYFNLANCYFKLGHIGPAVINYRRAEKLIPYSENLAINLKFTRQRVKDKIEDKTYSQVINNIIFWHYWFTLDDLIIVFLILNTLFFLTAILRVYVKTGIVRWVFFILSVFYLLSAVTTLGRFYEDRFQQEGVVTAGEVWVRSGNGFNDAVLFSLHEGAEFGVEEIKGSWVRISLVDGSKGWVQLAGVEII